MKLLEEAAEMSMVNRFGRHLCEKHAHVIFRSSNEKCNIVEMNEILLQNIVISSIRLARLHGFSRESDLLAFTVLRFVVAPNYHEQVPVLSVFGSDTIPVERRIERLWRYIEDADWEKIADAYDETAWHAIV
ncbi:hypothetical protein [Azospirillum argentinense]|uniref:hypothetical protein n=1 Tax=Azospirillum argentinense TaxID=2970906 RepID=UPI0032DF28CF